MLLKESFLSTEHTDSLAILAAAYLERKPERVKREREREREGGGEREMGLLRTIELILSSLF